MGRGSASHSRRRRKRSNFPGRALRGCWSESEPKAGAERQTLVTSLASYLWYSELKHGAISHRRILAPFLGIGVFCTAHLQSAGFFPCCDCQCASILWANALAHVVYIDVDKPFVCSVGDTPRTLFCSIALRSNRRFAVGVCKVGLPRQGCPHRHIDISACSFRERLRRPWLTNELMAIDSRP